MKALVILNNYKKFDGFIRDIVSDSFLNKAIEELEDLKSRSCSTCRYGRSFHFDEDIECMKLYDATQGLCFEKDFYCKNWESK